MIRRLVHMSFKPGGVTDFLAIFEESCEQIRGFPGCCEVTLLQREDRPNCFTTYSLWDDDASLQAYRQSELFRVTWARVKVLFDAPPTAASHRVVRHLD